MTTPGYAYVCKRPSEEDLDLLWAALLAGIAGYVDAICFLRLGGAFAANMTGNLVEIGLAAAQGQWGEAAWCVSLLIAFFLGILAARLILRTRPSPRSSLLIESAIVTAAAACLGRRDPGRLPRRPDRQALPITGSSDEAMLPALFASAILLGIVEGLTEFLPISSTCHLILADRLLGLEGPESKLFDIVIQLGAILAVCWVYRERLFHAAAGLATERTQQRFIANIVIAFLPAAVAGVILYRIIKDVLFSPWVVAVSFIVGGF